MSWCLARGVRLFLGQPRCTGDQYSIIKRDWKYTLISLSCHHFPFGSLTPRQAYSVPKSCVISISFRISILLKTRLSWQVVTQQFLFCDALSHILFTVFMHAEHFLESLFGTTSDERVQNKLSKMYSCPTSWQGYKAGVTVSLMKNKEFMFKDMGKGYKMFSPVLDTQVEQLSLNMWHIQNSSNYKLIFDTTKINSPRHAEIPVGIWSAYKSSSTHA